jgi:hypothetical protein
VTERERGLNIPLLRKVVEHIEAHPEEFDMGTWITNYPTRAYLVSKSSREQELGRPLCNTTMCAAGTTVFLAGGEFLKGTDWMCIIDGKRESISEAAAGLLGLDNYQEEEIFQALHIQTGEELRRHIEEVLDIEL